MVKMQTIEFKVTGVDKEKQIVYVVFGPLHFTCSVTEEDGKVTVRKPYSLYVEQPDYHDLIVAVKDAWKKA